MKVARSASSRRDVAPEQAHARDRRHAGCYAKQRLGAARDARRSAAGGGTPSLKFLARVSRKKKVASHERGVVKFRRLMRHWRVACVARSALSRRGIAPEQAHARDRRHAASRVPAKVPGGA
jgi:hypothetical protein